MALATNERERFESGLAAGDGKGDYLRTHSLKDEHAMTILFSWLSGGLSEVRLPSALPIERGGTGATSVAGMIKSMGYFQDVNNIMRRGVKVLRLANAAIVDRFGNVPTAKMVRKAAGTYEITGCSLDTTLFGLVLPTDHLGKIKYMATATELNGVITIKTSVPNYATFPPTMGALVDLPAGVSIDVEVK